MLMPIIKATTATIGTRGGTGNPRPFIRAATGSRPAAVESSIEFRIPHPLAEPASLVPRRRRAQSGGDFVPKFRRRQDLDLRAPLEDPAPDLYGARDAASPQDRAVGLADDLLGRMPGRLGHERGDVRIEAQLDLDFLLVDDDAPG